MLDVERLVHLEEGVAGAGQAVEPQQQQLELVVGRRHGQAVLGDADGVHLPGDETPLLLETPLSLEACGRRQHAQYQLVARHPSLVTRHSSLVTSH